MCDVVRHVFDCMGVGQLGEEQCLVQLEWRGSPVMHCWGHPEEGQRGLALPDCCGAVLLPALTPARRVDGHTNVVS